MASSGKKKTTMAKLMRETKLRERRAAKKARKDDRKRDKLNGTEESVGVLPDSEPGAEVEGESAEFAESGPSAVDG